MKPAPLTRKLLRDLLRMKGQVVAIAGVVGAGIAVFVTLICTYQSLRATKSTYYARSRFADLFASARRAPESLAARVAALPGIARVETRTVAEVVLDVRGLREPATGRLVSIPDEGEPVLNRLTLRSGRYPEPGRAGEALASESFARNNGLGPGDHVDAVINGRWQRLVLTGTALSPEFIYTIRPGELMPNDKLYGIFWMRREALAAALDLKGAFNDLVAQMARGASEPAIIEQLDRLLEPYGGIGAYGRDKQISDRYITNEIDSLKASGKVSPALFLALAAFLLNVALARIVSMQRPQVATLKALGYSRLQVGFHYLQLALLIVLLGSAAGIGAGIWLGRGMTRLYTQFFHLPLLDFDAAPATLAAAVLLAVAAAAIGGLGQMVRVMALPAAEAMRPEPPPVFGPTVLERLGWERVLSQAGRIVLRNLERRPLRALLSILGIALAEAILIVGLSQEDAVDYMIHASLNVAQRQDLTVSLVNPRSRRALLEMMALPGVLRAEPFRVVGATLRAGHRSYEVGLMGLQDGGTLRRLIDSQVRPVPLPATGMVLTDKLAEILGVQAGELLRVDVKEGVRRTLQIPVTGLLDEFLGVSGYATLESLNAFMREGDVVSGAFLAVDPLLENDLYDRLKGMPAVAAVSRRTAALEALEKTFRESLMIMRLINVIFAVIVVFGVVYNMARIALSERSRELATLRVLGFTRAEIAFILFGELAVLGLAALPVGCAAGYGLVALIVNAFSTELFRIPLVISAWTYAFAISVVMAAGVVSALLVRRKLDQLDLLAVLKSGD
jgi:putative ABC transport system permease protein